MSNHDILPADQILPNKLIIIPLTGNPIFPGIFTPLVIEDEQDMYHCPQQYSKRLISTCMYTQSMGIRCAG